MTQIDRTRTVSVLEQLRQVGTTIATLVCCGTRVSTTVTGRIMLTRSTVVRMESQPQPSHQQTLQWTIPRTFRWDPTFQFPDRILKLQNF